MCTGFHNQAREALKRLSEINIARQLVPENMCVRGMSSIRWAERLLVLMIMFIAFLIATTSAYMIRRHTYVIESKPFTRLCKKQNIITVNGQLPGPTLYARNGDTVIIKVSNKAQYNATIHWHGLRQLRTGWADGPAYITQCPIQPGASYTYRFNITAREGTLWWHAHVSWLRATVYGAIVIYPKTGGSYPFPRPSSEALVLLGEWWNENPIDVVNQANLTGSAPNISDAFTINGQPGDLYPCSRAETFRLVVRSGHNYLLRIVNAAMNNELFFSIAEHEFTVVCVDASYAKPYKTNVMIISPGQTADIMLTANKISGRYYMAARAYSSGTGVAFDNTTTTAILEYSGTSSSASPILPNLPSYNDTQAVTRFTTALRSLASIDHPVNVPQTVEENLLFTIGLGLLPCSPGQTCGGPNGTRFSASVNNISFVQPSIAVLQAYYFGIRGVYTTDFPSNPPIKFNYTGNNIPRSLWTPTLGTRVKVLNYNTTVQIVFQDTNILTGENHPMHIHGYNFYIVGQGFGNFNPRTDPLKFNLVDPPKRNTVGVPASGWAAVRFTADNPGAWFMHCHLDVHLSWGLSMVFLVKNGHSCSETLEPPPRDLPNC